MSGIWAKASWRAAFVRQGFADVFFAPILSVAPAIWAIRAAIIIGIEAVVGPSGSASRLTATTAKF